VSDWLDNDELFRTLLSRGHRHERLVAAVLRAQGLDAAAQDLRVRPDVEQRRKYRDNGDVLCCGQRIEVKARPLSFRGPDDLPYDTVFVDTVSKFNAMDPVPMSYVVVSTETGAMVATATAHRELWLVLERFDRVRRFRERFYAAPRRLWRPLGALVTALRGVQPPASGSARRSSRSPDLTR